MKTPSILGTNDKYLKSDLIYRKDFILLVIVFIRIELSFNSFICCIFCYSFISYLTKDHLSFLLSLNNLIQSLG